MLILSNVTKKGILFFFTNFKKVTNTCDLVTIIFDIVTIKFYDSTIQFNYIRNLKNILC